MRRLHAHCTNCAFFFFAVWTRWPANHNQWVILVTLANSWGTDFYYFCTQIFKWMFALFTWGSLSFTALVYGQCNLSWLLERTLGFWSVHLIENIRLKITDQLLVLILIIETKTWKFSPSDRNIFTNSEIFLSLNVFAKVERKRVLFTRFKRSRKNLKLIENLGLCRL